MPNERSPMLLDTTGIAIVGKLTDIATAISSGGGGGGGSSIKRLPTIVNTKKPNYFISEKTTAHLVYGVNAGLIGAYIWNFDGHYYYTKIDLRTSESYEIDTSSKAITDKTWINFSPSYNYSPSNLWTDGTDMYYSRGSHLKLDSSTGRWNSVNLGKSFNGSDVWTDGTDIYVSGYNSVAGAYNYILDQTNHVFIDKTWTNIPSNFASLDVWTDGTNVYYSNGSNQYSLDLANNQWVTKTWTGMSNFNGRYIWSWYDSDYGVTHYYYSYYQYSTNTQKELDISNDSWNSVSWSGLTRFSGGNVWNDGSYWYYSNGASEQYVLSGEGNWSTMMDYFSENWGGVTKTINAAFSNLNANIWTDGSDIYYSSGKISEGNQFVYNRSDGAWHKVNWYVDSDIYFNGSDVWTDGSRIFVSNRLNSDNYILNDRPDSYYEGALYTASIKDENDNTLLFDGKYVWTDGDHVYLSNGYDSSQYVLTGDYENDSKYVWEEKTWEGTSGFNPTYLNGEYIWNDGENIYFSDGSNNFMYNGVLNKWESKTWDIYDDLYGDKIWTDGRDIYLYGNSYSYVLDKATGSFVPIFSYDASLAIGDLWSDGVTIFSKLSSGFNYEYKIRSSRNSSLILHT
jgi:hypothetical protein